MSLLKLGFLLVLLPQTPRLESYSIRGSVVSDGTAVEQPVVVYLEPLSSRPIEEVRANASGDFTFRNVPEGSYFIRVKLDGFEEAAQRIEVPAFDRPIEILLRTKAGPKPLEVEVPPDTTFQVDIRNLSIPDDAADEHKLALDDKKQGRVARAIQRLRRVLLVAPNFLGAVFHLGSALYKEGHFEDAERILMRTLKTVPEEAHLRLLLANVLLKERKYDEALNQIDTYLAENPKGYERASAERTREQLIKMIRK